MRHNDLWHSATLRAHRDLSRHVREFEIRPEGGLKPWSVGAHLNLRLPIDGRDELRSYSLVGLPDQAEASGPYRIAVRRAVYGGDHQCCGAAGYMLHSPCQHAVDCTIAVGIHVRRR